MSTPLSDTTRTLWRAIRDAGPLGMTDAECAAAVDAPADCGITKARLLSLQKGGYIKPKARYKLRGWVVGCKKPGRESWEPGAPTRELPAGPQRQLPPPPPFHGITARSFCRQLGGTPRSVFHMAQLMGGSAS